MSLKKLNNEKTVYITQASKTLLEEIASEFTNFYSQSKALIDKQIEIAAHYQTQLQQTEDKLNQTEAKLAETESKLDSCNGRLIDRTQAVGAKEKELKDKQDEHDKLLSVYN